MKHGVLSRIPVTHIPVLYLYSISIMPEDGYNTGVVLRIPVTHRPVMYLYHISLMPQDNYNTGILSRIPVTQIPVMYLYSMGWLRWVGSIKSQVSSADYSLFYRALLQKRPMILSIVLTETIRYLSDAQRFVHVLIGCFHNCNRCSKICPCIHNCNRHVYRCSTANPTWGDIFECCFKAQSSKLERLFSLKRGKRDVRALSFRKWHPKWDWLYLYSISLMPEDKYNTSV